MVFQISEFWGPGSRQGPHTDTQAQYTHSGILIPESSRALKSSLRSAQPHEVPYNSE
jgi:hypothetical protein